MQEDAVIHEAFSDNSPELELFNSFGSLEIELPVSIEPVLNVIHLDNSVDISRERPSGVVIGNCHVKKRIDFGHLLQCL